MSNKFLVHGKNIETTELIRRKISILMPSSKLLTSTDIEKTKDIVSERSINLFIFETEEFGKKEFSLLRDFRVWGLSFPTLVITSKVLVSGGDKKSDSKPHFIESSYEDKKLVGLIKKLIRTKAIPQQLHPRFHTNQRVLIESVSDGRSIDSSMYNLSKGGAYCEFDIEDDLKFAIGDVVKISIPLAQISKQHAMNAKIMWTTKKGLYSGRNGFGLKFVNQEDLYRQLIGRLF